MKRAGKGKEKNLFIKQRYLRAETHPFRSTDITEVAGPSVEAHHHSVGPNTGRNSGERRIKKLGTFSQFKLLTFPWVNLIKIKVIYLKCYKVSTKLCLYIPDGSDTQPAATGWPPNPTRTVLTHHPTHPITHRQPASTTPRSVLAQIISDWSYRYSFFVSRRFSKMTSHKFGIFLTFPLSLKWLFTYSCVTNALTPPSLYECDVIFPYLWIHWGHDQGPCLWVETVAVQRVGQDVVRGAAKHVQVAIESNLGKKVEVK